MGWSLLGRIFLMKHHEAPQRTPKGSDLRPCSTTNLYGVRSTKIATEGCRDLILKASTSKGGTNSIILYWLFQSKSLPHIPNFLLYKYRILLRSMDWAIKFTTIVLVRRYYGCCPRTNSIILYWLFQSKSSTMHPKFSPVQVQDTLLCSVKFMDWAIKFTTRLLVLGLLRLLSLDPMILEAQNKNTRWVYH